METQKNYIIESIKSDSHTYLVLSTNYVRIDNFLPEIEKFMCKKKFRGQVIFDLLINNGFEDRFYIVQFNGNKFDYKTFKSIDEVDNDILKASSKFYLNHFEYIDNSLFPKTKKFLIKRELKKTLTHG